MNEDFVGKYEALFKDFKVPSRIKRVSALIMFRFTITGKCDGMYLANTIAFISGCGNGKGDFQGSFIQNHQKIAERLQSDYSDNIRREDIPELTKIIKNAHLDKNQALKGMSEFITEQKKALPSCDESTVHYLRWLIAEATKKMLLLQNEQPALNQDVFFHYEEQIFYQFLKYGTFRESLRDQKMEYIDLPICDADVVMYIRDGKKKYAYITAGEEDVEHVYITESVPLDMSWSNIARDYMAQKRGEAPMQLKTKAYVLLEEAERLFLSTRKRPHSVEDFFKMPDAMKPADIYLTLSEMGYNMLDLEHMDHSDIHPEIFKEYMDYAKRVNGYRVVEKRKVLINHGMSNDAMLIITDAPKEAIEEWCRNYVAEMEADQNTYFDSLKKKYYVAVLHDSEEKNNNDDVNIIGYDEVYDLSHYYEKEN